MGGSADPRSVLIGVTSGDPAGVGPEIALKAWTQRAAQSLPPFVMYIDPALLSQRARMLGLTVPIETVSTPQHALHVSKTALAVIPIPLGVASRPGHADSANSKCVVQSIDRAVEDCIHGHIGAVVTNPIAKSVLYEAGFEHPGHTEYLAALATKHYPGQRHVPVMMLASRVLRVVPLTIHVPIKDVPALITPRLISETVHTTWTALRRDFGIGSPRIRVTGLNPHAGEGGAIGIEERDIIAPAVRDLQREGLQVSGPYSADTMFHEAARTHYDAAVAMYHDQALIPIKTLAFDEGVNVTLGLPFVRTSPDHGTAFDIAAEGRASPTSLIAALKLAGIMAERRARARV